MRAPNESKTGRRRMAAYDRQLRALELRRDGLTYEQIAAALGYSAAPAAYKAVVAAMRRTLQGPADEYRQLHGDRLDALFRITFKQALWGDLRAADRCLAVMRRQAALYGLDAPKSHAVATPDPDPDWEPLLRELNKRLEGKPVAPEFRERLDRLLAELESGEREEDDGTWEEDDDGTWEEDEEDDDDGEA